MSSISMPKVALLVLGGLLLPASLSGLGCAAPASSDSNAPDGNASAIMASSPALHVSGPVAERLLNAFGALDAVDHAMGGRASVDVKALSVVTSSNGNLDDSDPMFLVPITKASFENLAESPSHRDLKDAAQRAKVLFDAIAAVDPSLSDSGMGQTWATAATVDCEGHGPGAGSDPKDPPPRTATCTVTSEAGESFRVSGPKALRIVQGFGAVDAIEYAMGGVFSVSATDVSCAQRSGTALEETDPLYALPRHSCSFSVGAAATTLTDAVPHALALRNALQAAGLELDSAMGVTGLTATHVECTKGPSAPTTCTIAR